MYIEVYTLWDSLDVSWLTISQHNEHSAYEIIHKNHRLHCIVCHQKNKVRNLFIVLSDKNLYY